MIITNEDLRAYNLVMRISGGMLKGREVKVPRGSRIRPATSHIRELVMDLFTPARLCSGVFLDLCAGSGINGFEAISRGALSAVFVETDGRTASRIRKTAQAFELADRCLIIRCDARRCYPAIRRHLAGTNRIAAALLDPPFIRGMAAEMLAALDGAVDVLTSNALVIVRTPDELPSSTHALRLRERRPARNACLWLFEPLEPTT